MEDNKKESTENENASGYDEAEILSEARKNYKQGRQDSSEWRKETKKCFDFRSGNQWTDADKAVLNDQMRMPVTFNRIDPYARAVAGLEAGNRQEIRYVPREIGDVGVNELYTEAARWVRDQAGAEYEDADAFQDTFASGIGCTETYLSYDNDEEGMVEIDRLDCLHDVVWDGNARKRNLTDRKWDIRIKRDVKLDDLKEMFPDKADQIGMNGGDWESEDDDAEPWDRNPETAYKKEGSEGSKKKCYSLVDYQWCEKEAYYKVLDPTTGQIVEMDDEKFEALSAKIKSFGGELKHAKLKRIVWHRAFIVGGTLLEVGYAPCKTSSSRKFITGYRDVVKKCWYGAIRAMLDPQEFSNKFYEQMLHILNANAKGGVFAEEGAFANIKKAEEQWSDASSMILLKSGGLGKIQQRTAVAFPAAFDRMMQIATSALGEVTGIPLEMIGMVDRQQAGVLESERKRTGITMLASLFDSFKQYHKEQGELILYYIKEHLSDGRLIRITGEGNQKYVPLVRQDDTIKFDVIVDEMPQSANNKERVWATMQVMLPLLMQAGMPPEMLGELISYSPLPNSFAEKLKQTMAQKGQQPPPPMLEAQLGKVKAETEKITAETYATNAKAGLDEAKSAATISQAGLDVVNANMMAEGMMGMGGQHQQPNPNPMPPQQPMQQPQPQQMRPMPPMPMQ